MRTNFSERSEAKMYVRIYPALLAGKRFINFLKERLEELK